MRYRKLASLRAPLPATVAAFLAVGAHTIDAASAKPTPVEVWSGGDDGLTLRLRGALVAALRSSPSFRLSSGKKPRTLVVTIPTHLKWKQIGGRTQVLYTVQFASTDEQNIGASTGSCWDDALAKCAAHIVKDTKSAAGKIR